MPIRLLNLRYGFATNSSSSHSIVLFPAGELPTKDTWENREDFGWEHFVLKSYDSKRVYLQAIVSDSYKALLYNERDEGKDGKNFDELSKVIALQVVPHISDIENSRDVKDIDHQSVLILPRNWDENNINQEFLVAFQQSLLRENVVVLGGNDNSEGHPLFDTPGLRRVCLGISQDYRRDGRIIAVRHENYWALFNRGSGLKTRISFDDLNPTVGTKAVTPELIDLKITNNCIQGCPYCYQDSKPGGKHADVDKIAALADAFEDMHVFEVALGGGEPLSHPNFETILEGMYHNHIVANFSTKQTEWLYNTKKVQRILDYCGRFALSIGNGADCLKLKSLLEDKLVPPKMTLHVIPELLDPLLFREVLVEASQNNIDVTLLGFKNTGRGENYKGPMKGVGWEERLYQHFQDTSIRMPRIGIDTCIVNKHPALLEKLHIHPILTTKVEGAFSMYIDGVAGTARPSSYTGKIRKIRALVEDGREVRGKGEQIAREIKRIFKTYPGENSETTFPGNEGDQYYDAQWLEPLIVENEGNEDDQGNTEGMPEAGSEEA